MADLREKGYTNIVVLSLHLSERTSTGHGCQRYMALLALFELAFSF